MIHIAQSISLILDSEHTGVLALGGENGEPYAALVAFMAEPKLDRLYFATLRTTRKYQRIIAQPQIALLIDTRRKGPDDFAEASALTVLGKVDEPAPELRPEISRRFTERFPALVEFIADPQCALLCVHVRRYILVERFQQVSEWCP